MAELVYLACALTSSACAALLLRSYLNGRSRLLLYSCLCFAGLALNNILLFIDLAVAPSIDLELARTAIALGSIVLLVIGLVWEAP